MRRGGFFPPAGGGLGAPQKARSARAANARQHRDPAVTATRAHQVPGGQVTGPRVNANPRDAKATGAIAAGVALASGWPECGSVAGATRSPTRAVAAGATLQRVAQN